MSASNNAVAVLGHWVRSRVAGIGYFTRFFGAMLARSGIAAKGVTINNLLPGKFDTDRLRTTFTAAANKSGKSLDDVRLVQQSQVPARRFGTPDEFGAICAFLCSAHAGYMTGQNILPDGGLYAGTF